MVHSSTQWSAVAHNGSGWLLRARSGVKLMVDRVLFQMHCSSKGGDDACGWHLWGNFTHVIQHQHQPPGGPPHVYLDARLLHIHEILVLPLPYKNSMKLVIPLHFISWKEAPNDAVTPQRQSQFTPKMNANAVPRLLSSLVWIDQYNECNGMTHFMEFMICM